MELQEVEVDGGVEELWFNPPVSVVAVVVRYRSKVFRLSSLVRGTCSLSGQQVDWLRTACRGSEAATAGRFRPYGAAPGTCLRQNL